MLGNEVVEYLVDVKGLQQRDGTREVEQFDVTGFNTEMREATVNQGLGINKHSGNSYSQLSSSFVYPFSAGEVPYNITVKALNLAGCSEEQQLYCFTQEGGIHTYILIHPCILGNRGVIKSIHTC